MQTINRVLNLLKRKCALEAAMRTPGGIRILEELELHRLREDLTDFPEATHAILHTAHALRRPVSEISAEDVAAWATAEQVA